jgi:rhamnosyltransferase
MQVSVVIRAKDEAESIGRTLDILHGQTVRAEVIVVDSGSTDGTPQIATARGARVLHIPAAEFTFGGALNLGAGIASAPVVVALSAHAFPRSDRWLERVLEPFEDERVACVAGAEWTPDGQPLQGRYVQDFEALGRHPTWGYTNAAGAFRTDLWREYPFRADMPGTEDKEWAWHWLKRGRVAVFGPEMQVDHDHTKDTVREQWTRATREWTGFAMYLPVERQPLREAVRAVWREGRAHEYRHPANWLRVAAAVAGEWWTRNRLTR